MAEGRPAVEEILRALGDVLKSQDKTVAIVVVGGAAMILDGHVVRTTRDIDVIAVSQNEDDPIDKPIAPPERLLEAISDAISRVARDYGLPSDWFNVAVSSQWETGLPPGLHERVTWRRFGGLWVGAASRHDLIFLKLYAAVDSEGPTSVHFQDLLALRPTKEELRSAAEWLRSQDVSEPFAEMLEQVIEHVRRNG